MSKVRWVAAFSAQGLELGRKLGGRLFGPERLAIDDVESYGALSDWAAAAMKTADQIVFVGSCGLAVRLIAPHLKDKTQDPAVVVVDETGQWSVALLSGHLGGAVPLAREIAALVGAQAVITTATDNRGFIAVDSFAAQKGWTIENPKAIVAISSAMLEGKPIGWKGPCCPEGYVSCESGPLGVVCSPWIGPDPFDVTLWLRPKVATLGVGCRRGKDFASLKAEARAQCQSLGLSPLALSHLASVDLKADEQGLIQLAKYLGLEFVTYRPDEQMALDGTFSLSPKALETLGVDCVCERAAVAGGRRLIRKKEQTQAATWAFALEEEWCDEG